MSDFIVSARKYRPNSFDNMIGQESIISTLKNAIKNNQLAQSFLFCGPRGVGKTTCARIFAKEINQVNDNEEIKDFSFNIFELDAASNNSVEDIRNLTDQVRIPPQRGKYKVYIIDEVHMLSTQAFNAFLKTLEEPPNHAKFILATTEKNKIIPTILSRCQIFDFKRVGVKDISNHLDFVAKSESVNVEKEALNLIAKKSDGSIRDALSLFDRLVNFSDSNLTYNSALEHLNILDYDYYFKISDAILKNDISMLLIFFNEILDSGFDGSHFINGLASHFRDLLVSKDEETVVLLDKGDVLRSRYLEQSSRYDMQMLLRSLEICNECDVQYKSTSNKRLLIEFSLMRIASIKHQTNEKKSLKTFVVSNTHKYSGNDKNKKDKEGKKEINESIKKEIKEDSSMSIKSTPLDRVVNKTRTISITSTINNVDNKINESKNLLINDYSFSNEEMINSWGKMVSFVKEGGKMSLAIALSSRPPLLKSDSEIEILLSNTSQVEIVEEEKYMLLDFLKNSLKNDKIKITTKVEKSNKDNTPYTNKDRFSKMLEDNNDLQELRVKLGLDPDY